MSWKALVSLTALLFSLCLGAPPAAAQTEGEITEAVTVEGTRLTVTLEPDEIPLFNVVEFFFRRISIVRRHADLYEKTLTDIGIQPGSEAANFLADVTDKAIEILNVSTVDGSLTGDAFMEHQYKAVREKARKLGVVYRNLLLGLEEAGVSAELVETYCEETIRPSITAVSDDDDNTRYLESVAEFEKQLVDMK